MPTAPAAPPPPSAAAINSFAEEGPPEDGSLGDGPRMLPRRVSLDARLGRLVCPDLSLEADHFVGRITEKRLVCVFVDGHDDVEDEHDEVEGALCASSDRRVADHGRPGRECGGCADRGACTPRWRIQWEGVAKEKPGTGLLFAHTLSAADTVRLTRYALALRREELRLPEVLTRISVEEARRPGARRVRWCLRFEKAGVSGLMPSGVRATGIRKNRYLNV